MLVITRRVGECLMLDKDIWLTVVEVRGNQVRLGITAPRDVPVHRGDCLNRGENHEPSHPLAPPPVPEAEAPPPAPGP